MSDQTVTPTETTPPKRSFFQTLELDMRLLGMIGAFILVALSRYSGLYRDTWRLSDLAQRWLVSNRGPDDRAT